MFFLFSLKKKKKSVVNKTLDEGLDWCPRFRGRIGYSFNQIDILLVLQIHCFPLVSHKVPVMHMRDSISSCELCRRREVFVVLKKKDVKLSAGGGKLSAPLWASAKSNY